MMIALCITLALLLTVAVHLWIRAEMRLSQAIISGTSWMKLADMYQDALANVTESVTSSSNTTAVVSAINAAKFSTKN